MMGYLKYERNSIRIMAVNKRGRDFRAEANIAMSDQIETHLKMRIASRELDNLCNGLEEIMKGRFEI